MKAVFLVKKGIAANAFEIREAPIPLCGNDQVLIKVAAFGLNFADVMARRGMYKEAPPMPSILGYDVAGIVIETGAGVTHISKGDRVIAMTRFGGYAEYAITAATGVAKMPSTTDFATATALTTQYCTAYFAAAEVMNLHAGDKVLIHAGAGGVGRALIQFAKYRQCEIFSTVGSNDKLKYLETMEVHHPINYRKQHFEKVIMTATKGIGVDAIFDAVGGSSVRKGFKLLAPGGKIVCYGAAAMTNKNIFGKIASFVGFGFYHPIMLMMQSKTITGLNMLTIADNKPLLLQKCLEAVMQLTEKGIFEPLPATTFKVNEIAAAHEMLESRKSMGKLAIEW